MFPWFLTAVLLIQTTIYIIIKICFCYRKEDSVEIDKICTTVVVGYEGWLYTGTIPVLSGHCVPDWTKWPFDIQNCEMHLTSRQYLGNEVDFALAAYDSFHQVRKNRRMHCYLYFFLYIYNFCHEWPWNLKEYWKIFCHQVLILHSVNQLKQIWWFI